ncbi:FtsX-like permease family protein [Brevibacillus fluminis]|nr:ABC transporter permease [Brevibacillus fluminis]
MTFRQLAFNNVLRNKRTYAAYFLSSAFSVMVFFVYAMFMYHPQIEQTALRGLVVEAMRVAEGIIYVFSFFFILYSVGAFFKSRKREFGVLMMHGMSQGQLNRMVFLENMLIGLASMVTGIGAGMISSKLILLIGVRVLNMDQLPFYMPVRAILLTAVSFSLLFLVISLFTAFFVRGSRLIELLQGSVKPKKEPKASVILSLLSAVLIVSAYYLSVTTTEYTIGIRLIPVVLMVIVGTYFFFTQLSVFSIRLLKRNRQFFWKQTNLVTLSDLAYRMKDNARIFFLVTMVSTVAFCAVGTLASTAFLEQQAKDNSPFAFNYIVETSKLGTVTIPGEIEDGLKNANVPFDKVRADTKSQTSVQTGNRVTLVKESDFNRIAAKLGYPQEKLNGREARFIPPSLYSAKEFDEYNKEVTFKESDITVFATGRVEKSVLPSYVLGGNILLVSDRVFAQITRPIEAETFIGYNVVDWKKTEKLGEALTNKEPIPDTHEYFSSFAYQVMMMKQASGAMLFIGVLVGAVFFIAAGSFLYFRLYTDLEHDQRQYQAISKIGLTEKELNQIVTRQLLLLFFVPIVMAMIHSGFAFVALQSVIYYPIAIHTITVLACFLIAQVMYFLLIRARYLRHVKAVIS